MELVQIFGDMNFWLLFIIGFLGMFTHFMKKNIKGETPTEVLSYFKDNFKTTLTTVIITFIATIGYNQTLATGMPADYVNAFMIGFTADSILNKWEIAGAKVRE